MEEGSEVSQGWIAQEITTQGNGGGRWGSRSADLMVELSTTHPQSSSSSQLTESLEQRHGVESLPTAGWTPDDLKARGFPPTHTHQAPNDQQPNTYLAFRTWASLATFHMAPKRASATPPTLSDGPRPSLAPREVSQATVEAFWALGWEPSGGRGDHGPDSQDVVKLRVMSLGKFPNVRLEAFLRIRVNSRTTSLVCAPFHFEALILLRANTITGKPTS